MKMKKLKRLKKVMMKIIKILIIILKRKKILKPIKKQIYLLMRTMIRNYQTRLIKKIQIIKIFLQMENQK